MESDSESGSDLELQEAFAEGKLRPGLNKIPKESRTYANNISGLKQKLSDLKLKLPWVETLNSTTKEAPLAPELASQLLEQEQKRERELKGNKKLPQFAPSEDPVLNDFKREMIFYRQAQATVMEAIPKLRSLGIPTKRPDDYFAEMAKTDEHMQKIREHLMKKQVQQQRSEKVRQLRTQRKEGKMLQIQTKLQQQKEKKEMLEQIKKVRKGVSKNLDFLDEKRQKTPSKKNLEKRKLKDKKFGFGGKKKGSKLNTRDSAADISEYHRQPRPSKSNYKNKNMRPGKSKRVKNKARRKK